MQLTCDAADLIVESMGKPDERLVKWLKHLEGNLVGSRFCGDDVTYADFAVYYALVGLAWGREGKEVEIGKLLEDAPKLSKWFVNMHDEKGCANVKATGVAIMPDSFRK
jgi:glutathione S-transferase